jgi:hypothetical protein
MPDLDQLIEAQEVTIPNLGASSARSAFQKTLKAGHSVLVTSNGYLCEVTPDGKVRQMKKIEPRIPVKAGTKLTIR